MHISLSLGFNCRESSTGGGVPSFTPTDDANVLGWLDPTDTGQFTLSGSDITNAAWKGAGSFSDFRNVAYGAYRPSLTSKDGIGYMAFGGSSFLEADIGAAPSTGTIWSNIDRHLFMLVGQPGLGNGLMLVKAGTNIQFRSWGGNFEFVGSPAVYGNTLSGGTPSSTDWQVVELVTPNTPSVGTPAKIVVDGVDVDTTTSSRGGALNFGHLGAGDHAAGNGFDGSIADIIVYDGLPTGDALTNIRTFLNARRDALNA